MKGKPMLQLLQKVEEDLQRTLQRKVKLKDHFKRQRSLSLHLRPLGLLDWIHLTGFAESNLCITNHNQFREPMDFWMAGHWLSKIPSSGGARTQFNNRLPARL
jgi:hypothetical protein